MTDKALEKRFIKARKSLIQRDFGRLNDMQQKAVMATEGPLLLLAGAGSGKTTVLIHRIANLLRYGRGSDSVELPREVTEEEVTVLEQAAAGVPEADYARARGLAAVEPCEPWRIIAITFTNKAAGELKARLEKMLGPEALDIWAQTFHSACVRILRSHADKLGYDKSFTIYDSADSQAAVKRILKELEISDKDFPPKTVLGYISRAKDDMQTPAEFLVQAQAVNDIRKKRIGEVYASYTKSLKKANAMDFDDLIYNTVLLLENHADVREHYQKRFKYVLIDEYQDTNQLQYRLAKALAGGRNNICVVGDDDQSIYKFRGATIENILSFESEHKNARVIRLEQNYRSTRNILSAANAVIRNNTERKGKELWTDKDMGEKLTLYVAQNENDEAQYVASRIMESVSQGDNFRDTAVLYRMNAQTNKLEYAFKRNGVPYRIIGGTRFFDRLEVKDMLAYLFVILSPLDDLRLLRIINSPPRGIGEKTIETAAAIAADRGLSLFEVVQNAPAYPELSKGAAAKLRTFAELMESFIALSETATPDALFDEIIDKTGYVRALEEKNNDESNARIENVGELKSNILGYLKETENGSLAGFLDEVSLYSDIDNLEQDDNNVVLMTMHSAKGLEFDNVYIIGVEEGIFPGVRCIGEPEEMEEERRLCYVGLTRAKKRLSLICARQRMLFGRTSSNSPSRFVDEIPAEYIERREAPGNDSFVSTRSSASGGATYDGVSRSGFNGGEARKPVFSEPARKPLASRPAAPAAVPAFKLGDMVEHSAFGKGSIIKMTTMGGDSLVEIQFEQGTKRLMLKAAAMHMKKI